MPENYVFLLVLIKVDQKDITLSRLCYYLSESTRGTNTKTMFSSPYIYMCVCGKLLEKGFPLKLKIAVYTSHVSPAILYVKYDA